MGQPHVVRPDDRAPHSAWMAYAVSHGMPAEQARGLTRDQIRRRFPVLVGAEPDLEQLEPDPEIRAARRETRRPAWERT